jgi:uncharacterized protein YneR
MNQSKHQIKTSLFQEKPWHQSQSEAPISKLLRYAADMVSKLPSSIQSRLMNWIDDFGLFFLRIGKIIQFSHQPYYLIHGSLKGSEEISLLFQGDLTSFQFFLKQLFPDPYSPKITIISQESHDKKDIKQLQNEVDMIIFETDRFFNLYYQRKGFLVIPETISFHLPLDRPIEKIIKSTTKRIQKDLMTAKSIGYQYTTAHDLHSFSVFYHSMYLPYVTWKHRNLQKIISFEAMRHYALRGSHILFVNKQDEHIFGGIYDCKHEQITTQYSGLKQGKFNHVRQGIITISYYYLMIIGKQHDVKYIDFGASSPFLNDGLNRYKRGWNMTITPSKPVFSTIFAVKIKNISDSITQFFQKTPFFFFKKEDLSLAYFIKKDDVKIQTKKDIIKQNHLKGIDHNVFYLLFISWF